tara:strand:- start:891 stop:1109 length:219 start_codon:yes stop_codon:yes gene_type:complete
MLMSKTNKLPNDKEFQEIIRKREEDIKERGKDFSVFDCSGKVVTLQEASIWYDENCEYVRPKSTQEITCIIS